MIALVALSAFATTAAEVADPRPGHVVDLAQVLLPGDAASIEERISRCTRSTTFAVIVPSAGDAHALARGLYEGWHLGDRDVVMLVVTGSRAMETYAGADLRPALTDSWMLGMQQRTLAPYLERGEFRNGMLAAVDAIDRAEPQAFAVPQGMFGGLAFGGIVVFAILGQYFGFGRRGHGSHWGHHHHGHSSGGFSGGGGGGGAGGTGSSY